MELDDLDTAAARLRELLEEGTTVAEVQKASQELRLVNTKRSEVAARIEANKGVDVGDPKAIAAQLMKSLPAIARADAALGLEIRDSLCQILPLKPGELLERVMALAVLDAEYAEAVRSRLSELGGRER